MDEYKNKYIPIIDEINFLRYKKEQALRDNDSFLFNYYSEKIYNKNNELKIMLDKKE